MEHSIKQRVEKIRTDQQERLDALARSEHQALRKAQLVEARADDIDKVITVMRSAIDNGVSWDDLHEYVVDQQGKGNPIAHMVYALKLETNTVVVLLEDDEEDGAAAAYAVDIDLGQSAHSNARRMFAHMKVAQKKKVKTAEASAACRPGGGEAERRRAEEALFKAPAQGMRKVYWFEKFNWFITSENFLSWQGGMPAERSPRQAVPAPRRCVRPRRPARRVKLHLAQQGPERPRAAVSARPARGWVHDRMPERGVAVKDARKRVVGRGVASV